MTDSVMRRVRHLVVEALYESENSNHDAEVVYERLLRDAIAEDPAMASPGPTGLGRGAIRGVQRMRDELDGRIQAAATQYPVNTMAVVDRNILRLAIWELVTDNAAPVGAVVNEAVELAHRYSGETSPAFVNGVLRTISERIGAERAGKQPREALPSNPTSQES